MLPREQWEKPLRALKCEPLKGKGPLNTAEWWIAPWGFVFTVPIEEPDDRCEFWALAALIDDINQSRPPDWPNDPPNLTIV